MIFVQYLFYSNGFVFRVICDLAFNLFDEIDASSGSAAVCEKLKPAPVSVDAGSSSSSEGKEGQKSLGIFAELT